MPESQPTDVVFHKDRYNKEVELGIGYRPGPQGGLYFEIMVNGRTLKAVTLDDDLAVSAMNEADTAWKAWLDSRGLLKP